MPKPYDLTPLEEPNVANILTDALNELGYTVVWNRDINNQVCSINLHGPKKSQTIFFEENRIVMLCRRNIPVSLFDGEEFDKFMKNLRQCLSRDSSCEGCCYL